MTGMRVSATGPIAPSRLASIRRGYRPVRRVRGYRKRLHASCRSGPQRRAAPQLAGPRLASCSPSRTGPTSSTRCGRSPAAASTGRRRSGGRRAPTPSAPFVKGVLERHPTLSVAAATSREWLSRAVTGWVGRVDGGQARGRRALRARDDRRRARRAAGRARRRARRAAVAAVHAEVAEALLEIRGARLDQRALRCASRLQVDLVPGARDARARRGLRRAALQARHQLGPGDAARVPRAAGVRGARAHAAGRPVPARAAGALPAAVRRRAGRQRPRRARPAARASTTRRSTTCGAPAPHDAPALEAEERLGGELRPFQRAGVDYVLQARRTFLADEQGLGKTVQALAALEADDAYPAVIVCPAGLKLNWRREIEHWLPHRSLTVVSGTGGHRRGGRDHRPQLRDRPRAPRRGCSCGGRRR